MTVGENPKTVDNICIPWLNYTMFITSLLLFTQNGFLFLLLHWIVSVNDEMLAKNYLPPCDMFALSEETSGRMKIKEFLFTGFYVQSFKNYHTNITRMVAKHVWQSKVDLSENSRRNDNMEHFLDRQCWTVEHSYM